MSAATAHLRRLLERERVAGTLFAAAWPVAVRRSVREASPTQREEWRDAIESTRAAWERAYQHEPPTAPERVLVGLFTLLD